MDLFPLEKARPTISSLCSADSQLHKTVILSNFLPESPVPKMSNFSLTAEMGQKLSVVCINLKCFIDIYFF